MHVDVHNANSATSRSLEIKFIPIRTILLRTVHFSLWCRRRGRAPRLHERCDLNCVTISEFWYRWSNVWLCIPQSCIGLQMVRSYSAIRTLPGSQSTHRWSTSGLDRRAGKRRGFLFLLFNSLTFGREVHDTEFLLINFPLVSSACLRIPLWARYEDENKICMRKDSRIPVGLWSPFRV